jgi:hypothetical protein
VWRAVEPLLVLMAADPARFNDVTALGDDEHIWHHVRTKPVEYPTSAGFSTSAAGGPASLGRAHSRDKTFLGLTQ